MNIIEALNQIKTDLTGIVGIKSVAIGIETGINANDYPAIRIVPLEHKPDSSLHRTRFGLDVYVGYATKPQSVAESYTTLYAWCDQVIERLELGNGYAAMWQGTTNDEDRLPAAKLMCVSFEVVV